jgi:hypothetical protein
MPDFPISFPDTTLVLNNNGRGANVDVGLVFNRSLGTTSNVAFYWNEATQSFITAQTNSAGTVDANIVPTSYANITSGVVNATTIYTTNGIFYANGEPAGGTPGGAVSSLQYNNNQNLSGANIYYNNTNGNLAISSVTPSTSFNTGAVVVDGGIGVAGSAYISAVYTNGLYWASNSAVIQTGGGSSSQMSMDWGLITDAPTAGTTYDFGTIAGASGYTVTTITIGELAQYGSADLMNGSDEIDLLEPNPGTASFSLA